MTSLKAHFRLESCKFFSVKVGLLRQSSKILQNQYFDHDFISKMKRSNIINLINAMEQNLFYTLFSSETCFNFSKKKEQRR